MGGPETITLKRICAFIQNNQEEHCSCVKYLIQILGTLVIWEAKKADNLRLSLS